MNLRVHPSRIQPESTAQIRVSDPERHHDDPRMYSRDRRIVKNCTTQATPMLKQHASLLEISIEQSAVVIRGNLPTDAMKAERPDHSTGGRVEPVKSRACCCLIPFPPAQFHRKRAGCGRLIPRRRAGGISPFSGLRFRQHHMPDHLAADSRLRLNTVSGNHQQDKNQNSQHRPNTPAIFAME